MTRARLADVRERRVLPALARRAAGLAREPPLGLRREKWRGRAGGGRKTGLGLSREDAGQKSRSVCARQLLDRRNVHDAAVQVREEEKKRHEKMREEKRRWRKKAKSKKLASSFTEDTSTMRQCKCAASCGMCRRMKVRGGERRMKLASSFTEDTSMMR